MQIIALFFSYLFQPPNKTRQTIHANSLPCKIFIELYNLYTTILTNLQHSACSGSKYMFHLLPILSPTHVHCNFSTYFFVIVIVFLNPTLVVKSFLYTFTLLFGTLIFAFLLTPVKALEPRLFFFSFIVLTVMVFKLLHP